jgi:hypothetical protein
MTRSTKFRSALVAGLGLFILFEVITRSLPAYFAAASPETALRLRSGYPAAVLNLAETQLNHNPKLNEPSPAVESARDSSVSGNTGEPQSAATEEPAGAAPSAPNKPDASSSYRYQPRPDARLQSAIERALRQDPLNARAFRLLGQLSSLRSDEERTRSLMEAAVRRSQLQSIAVYWMLRKSYLDHDYRAALGYADILLRTRSLGMDAAIPLVEKIAEIPQGRYELKQLLKTDPPWRDLFFNHLPSVVTDARTPLELLLDLKDTPRPPTTLDIAAYLNFLVEHGFYELAYYTWLQFLAPEQLARAGDLYNGDFATVPSGLPFDWVFTKGTGVSLQIALLDNKSAMQALSLQFGPGRIDYRDIAELLVLPPGGYHFSGKYKADLVSERGLQWRIACAGDKPADLGQSEAVSVTNPGWKDFEFSFTVPETDCPAQYLRLVFDARSASERFISGTIRYADLRIVRMPKPDAASANDAQ